MSDVYAPGITSRFNTEKLVEDLMRVERLPRDRAERNLDSLETQKTWWRDVGTRLKAVSESARFLFSFQNPFNDRTAISADENVITATATREAIEQDYRFAVKQLAQADRFLSPPLDEKTRIEAGTYTFTAGKEEVSLNFRGGSLREFVDALNRRGRDKVGASLITVQPGSRSLLLESKVTGAENRLGFSGDAALLAVRLGIAEPVNDSRRELPFSAETVRETDMPGGIAPSGPVTISNGVVELPSFTSATIPFGLNVDPNSPLVLKIETATAIKTDAAFAIPMPPPGPSVPSSGSISYGGISVENSPSSTPLPVWTPPPPPQRLDNLAVLSLVFSDGSTAALEPITDTGTFVTREYNLAEIAGGKTIAALNIENANTHRDISVRGAEVYDPGAVGGGYKPLDPVSTAQDAIVSMEGIQMIRPSNTISDIIPGVTITARGVSERPVRLRVETDREGIKTAIMSLVGNYNLLMVELNVLTARRLPSGMSTSVDDSIINELTYLTAEEVTEMRAKLGGFSGDSTITQLKNSLQRAVTSPYPTEMERELALLTQLGISTNAEGSGAAGYSQSRLRGYLQIDDKKLDAALDRNLQAVKQLFGSDTSGDMLVDTGVAFNLDSISRPFHETGGIITLKTNTIDSRLSQDRRRIESMDRQLAAKEAELKVQYARMESAYARMEQMTSSLENFSRQNSNNR